MECCPPEEALRQLLEGRPDESENGALAAHLTHCSRCQKRLDELSDAADVRLAPAVAEATLTETWTAFLRNLAASPPNRGTVRSPNSPPAVSCPPDYEVLGELGRGGMGVVYKARDRKLPRPIALKCLLDPQANADRRERFRREAEAAAKLSHPHIVRIYAIVEHEGQIYLALEYVDGGSLAAWLEQTPIEAREAARLIEVLARAMHAAHQQGIVHRDLKPANILLQRLENDRTTTDACELLSSFLPKIADFGVAKHTADEGRLTRTGDILGTPEYMAPEQADGPRDRVGPRADVYALGAILYEMLTRRPPFQGVTPFDVWKQVTSPHAQPVPPREVNARTPRDLETICLTCLAKEPRRRYDGALALAEDVKRFLEGRPILARPPGRLEVAAKWARRHPGWAALLGAIAVGLPLLSVLAFLLYVSRNNLESALGRETTLRQRAEQAEKTTRQQAHAETVAAARVEAGRGMWDEALRRYDQAIDHDFPDRADLEVERVRCLLPARHRQRLREELDRLSGRDELAKHRSQLLLYRATLLLTEQDRFKEGRALLGDVLREPKGLTAADQLFARGLLAESSDQAAALLRQALQEDPFHYPARSALVTEMLVAGRFAEVRREAAVMRTFYRTDPLPDYVLALTAVMEGQPDVRDRHLEALRPLLRPAHHQAVSQFLREFAAVLRLAEAVGRGENTMRNGLALAGKMPRLQHRWLHGPDPIAMPAPPIARLFEVMDEVFAASRGALFNREAAVSRLLRAAHRHPESAVLYLAAHYEFERAALAYFSKKDRVTTRAILERVRDLASRAAEAPTLLPRASFGVEARWLAVMTAAALRVENDERIRMDATRILLAPASGNPWHVVSAMLVTANREPPAFRRDWLREQLHRLARESREQPKLREERFPLLVRSLEPELALELLRRWQDDDPGAWRPQPLRAETELRAGHHAAALEWAERVLHHPRATARDRQAMHSLQATTRQALRRLSELTPSKRGSK